MIRFSKYQALGNDYLVVDETDLDRTLTPDTVRRICDRHYGIGADGLLLLERGGRSDRFALRVLNPDGSEAEKSGNGLRIFARYLWERGLAPGPDFPVETRGGRVFCEVGEAGKQVTVEMGRVSFHSRDVPVAGPEREVLQEEVVVGGETLRYSAATIGNPHCVVVRDRVSASDARRWGPALEVEPRFPNRTNVQFLEVLDRSSIRIEIWERGAGYTLASGTSSCAAAAVALRLGWCDSPITVQMPGGALRVAIDADFSVRMSGPVGKIGDGVLADEGLE